MKQWNCLKLLQKVTEVKHVENVPNLEITEVVLVNLVNSNIVNNDYQHDSWVFYTFLPKKFFGQFLDVLPKNFIFLKIFNSEFSYI